MEISIKSKKNRKIVAIEAEKAANSLISLSADETDRRFAMKEELDPWSDAIEPIDAKQPFDRFESSIKPPFHTLLGNLKFVWGGSAPPNTDCVGLVIAFLRYHGFLCPWESEIPRRFREYNESRAHMLDRGFVPDVNGNIALLNHHPYAHIAFIERGLVCHQTLIGLQKQQLVGVTDRFRYEGD